MPISLDKTTCDNSDQRLPEELAFLGLLTPEQRLCLPDWMVIGPPKTGTGWIYANLGAHPQAFVPPIKELKYFSNRFEVEDLRCYLSHFRRGVGKAKGEASPSYSILPRRTIQVIRRLMPNLKLIFLMRDPIDRAWSHARHNFRQREADFKGWQGAIDEVTEDRWIESLNHDWNRLSGDYLGQLQRWLSVFPREQFYLGFFEDLARSPRGLLRGLLQFLGIDPEFANSDAVTVERVNPGVPKDLSPRVERHLVEMYGERTAELVEFLGREFNLTSPPEWERTRATAIQSAPFGSAVLFAQMETEHGQQVAERLDWQVDDDTLAALLARDDLFEMDFLGFNIVRRGEKFLAYRMSLGELKPDQFAWEWWTEQARVGNCLFAENPYDLKSMIVRHCLSEAEPPGSEFARLRQVELRLEQFSFQQDGGHSLLGDALKRLENLERRQMQTDEQCEELRRSRDHVLDDVLEQSQALQQGHSQLVDQCRSLQHGQGQLVEREESLRSGHGQLNRELKNAYSRLQTAQIDLLEIKRRIDTWERSTWFRVLEWISDRLPKPRSNTTAAERARRQAVGTILVRQEPVAESENVGGKPMLPHVACSDISHADCPSASG